MFNIGLGELFFIVLLVLVVVGPERLPKIMRDFGRIVRQARGVVNEFTSQFGDELQSFQELQQPIQELQQLANDINPVKQVTKIAMDLDVKASSRASTSSPPTVRAAATKSPGSADATRPTLVKPTAVFQTPPPRATNPVKMIARARQTDSHPQPDSPADDS